MATLPPPALDGLPPVRIEGKFFWAGAEKLYLRGVTYGPFAPTPDGDPYPQPARLAADFADMAAAGVNTVRTFTAPPPRLLDAAAAAGLRVLAGLAWPHHLAFLDDPGLRRSIAAGVADAVRGCGRHPAILAYIVGNEIGPDLLRWHGVGRVAAFLGELAAIVRRQHPGALVSYAGYPSAEYLEPAGIDFVSFNVYLHEEADFRRYLARLHNIAGPRPLVLSELGMDTLREGEAAQNAYLGAQLRAAFDAGAAGACIFAWTDEWHSGGQAIEDWAFGLVDADRRPKPALEVVAAIYTAALPSPLPATPRVSVVVCAYDAARTLAACLASLRRLDYPDYQVIIVDDGSRDATAAIAMEYPEFHLIRQANQGLSVARNVGAAAADGEIVAYTDSDCLADPDWLHFLVRQFQLTGYAAVGGPNLPPPEDELVPSAVAVAPGGPTPVLLTDSVAEHIAGCNMAIRRDVLRGLGAFDPLYRTAGDDVDLCWRLQDAGHTIGYAPAAMVWHYRRNSVAAYFAQQKGYGRAEALVWLKHPARFNLWGQARWGGRIYGGLSSSLLPARPTIYGGPYGRAPFQRIYARADPWSVYLPLTFEWNAAALLLALAGLVRAPADGRWLLLTAPLLVSLAQAVAVAVRAPIDPRFGGVGARALVAFLVYLSPLLRGWARLRQRLRVEGPYRTAAPTGPVVHDWRQLALTAAFWSEAGVEKEAILARLRATLGADGVAAAEEPGWRAVDLDVPSGLWATYPILLATERHGGPLLLHRARVGIRPSPLALLALTAVAVLEAGLLVGGRPGPALAIAAAALVLAAVGVRGGLGRARYLMGRLDEAARALGLSMVS